MAATPLAVSPEAVELRVGDPLRLQLPTGDARVVGEISWFFEGSPLPAQTGPVCRCAVALARSVCALALARRARALLDARGVGGAQAAMRRGLACISARARRCDGPLRGSGIVASVVART